MLTYLLIGLAAVVLLLAVVFAVVVDDWSRDLTTNVAALDSAADDPLLRPLESTRTPDEIGRALSSVVATLPRWSSQEIIRQHDAIEHHLVHTTAMLRFADDVVVRIEPRGAGSLVTATSKSRIGRGDLGQNPRNLRELMAALGQQLAAAGD